MLQPGDKVFVGLEDDAAADGWVVYEVSDEGEIIFRAPCGIVYRPGSMANALTRYYPWSNAPDYYAPPAWYFMVEQLVATGEMPGC